MKLKYSNFSAPSQKQLRCSNYSMSQKCVTDSEGLSQDSILMTDSDSCSMFEAQETYLLNQQLLHTLIKNIKLKDKFLQECSHKVKQLDNLSIHYQKKLIQLGGNIYHQKQQIK
ncbi:hypothetical protein SS50377_26744 [Spironucleus salmonicida]|uniref:Uncharacterized protein n=1 Tax=Spironucleus salmonicida TaxID=348837 RepID=A0A9P8LLC2_9EUKA|nr:hypothetical protein SS50377_26744 [Spironucleus salmonicida]